MATLKKKKPLPRSRRTDFTGDQRFSGIPQRERRDRQVSRRGDLVQNISIGLEDIDGAIDYYIKKVLKPTVVENGKVIPVPFMYGDMQRWKSAQKDGFLRDKKGKIIAPVMMFKRTSVDKNSGMPVDKIDRNVVYNFQKTWSRQNRYDQFSVLTNTKPTKELHQVIIPDYVILNYDFIIWTS